MSTTPHTDVIAPILGQPGLAHLRDALAVFTVDSVNEAIGWDGQAAFARTDLCGVSRLLGDSATDTLIRLFLLGESVPSTKANACLGRPAVEAIERAGIIEPSVDEIRARIEIRPFTATNEGDFGGPAGDRPSSQWHLFSDFGSDVRPRPLHADHVLGASRASRLLADCTIGTSVGRTLDVGTGSGFQAFNRLLHSARVTGTDVNVRALRFAATSAALAGVELDLRVGAGFAPVEGEAFDLIVANPPFVMSPGASADGGRLGSLTYRDSGQSGDSFCKDMVGTLPEYLSQGGTAQLLANWAIRSESDLVEAIRPWIRHGTISAWVWQREVVDPGEYIGMWLRDDGEVPNSPAWRSRYDRWRGWFNREGIVAVGMGLVNLRRTGADGQIVVQDVPQQVELPIGAEIEAWFSRLGWLCAQSDLEMMGTVFRTASDLRLITSEPANRPDLATAATDLTLALTGGMRWQVECDAAMSAVVAGCDGRSRLSLLNDIVADAHGLPRAAVGQASVDLVRDLVQRGMLLPVGQDHGPAIINREHGEPGSASCFADRRSRHADTRG